MSALVLLECEVVGSNVQFSSQGQEGHQGHHELLFFIIIFSCWYLIIMMEMCLSTLDDDIANIRSHIRLISDVVCV